MGQAEGTRDGFGGDTPLKGIGMGRVAEPEQPGEETAIPAGCQDLSGRADGDLADVAVLVPADAVDEPCQGFAVAGGAVPEGAQDLQGQPGHHGVLAVVQKPGYQGFVLIGA